MYASAVCRYTTSLYAFREWLRTMRNRCGRLRLPSGRITGAPVPKRQFRQDRSRRSATSIEIGQVLSRMHAEQLLTCRRRGHVHATVEIIDLATYSLDYEGKLLRGEDVHTYVRVIIRMMDQWNAHLSFSCTGSSYCSSNPLAQASSSIVGRPWRAPSPIALRSNFADSPAMTGTRVQQCHSARAMFRLLRLRRTSQTRPSSPRYVNPSGSRRCCSLGVSPVSASHDGCYSTPGGSSRNPDRRPRHTPHP